MDLNEFQVNLVPFPRLHFLLSSLAPLFHAESAYHEMNSVADLTRALFQRSSALFGCGDGGKYMSACLLYRGEVFPNEISQSIQSIKGKLRFVDWCPTGFKVGINSTPPPSVPSGDLPYFPRTACMIANTTSIAKMFQCVTAKYDMMYTKRAFVHWFVGEGMEEGEFAEAREELLAMENDYQMCVADDVDMEL